MLILNLETAITDRLKVALPNMDLPNIQVLPFPTDPAELGLPVTARQIYVGFKQENLEAPDSITKGGRIPHQKRKLQYELVLRMQDLRSHQSAYPAMDAVRGALTGFRPSISSSEGVLTTGFYQLSGGFVDFGAGLWLYSMTFAINGVFRSQGVLNV